MKNLLVIVDVTNGFINFGMLADSKINKIIPNIIDILEKSKEEKFDIIATKDWHSSDDEEFKIYPVHCLKESEESEFVPELKCYEDDFDLVIKKKTTNAFKTKKFKNVTENNEYENVYVTGCCTDICVKEFVNSYLEYIKKENLQTKINVIDDACYTFDNENHDADQMHREALKKMKNKGANVILTNEFINKKRTR